MSHFRTPIYSLGGTSIIVLGSCASSAISPEGVQAQQIEHAWWLFFVVAVIVYAVVLASLGYALMHRRRREMVGPALAIDRRREKRTDLALIAWVSVTVLLLVALTAVSYATDARLISLGDDGSVDIEVSAQQWWWQVRYLNEDPSQTFITANEIHVPVGVPIRLSLRSPDVIHSFWAPDLNGKQDVIPGRDNALAFRVDRPGTYRGQCAEFCGIQHARMAFQVVAQSPQDFEAWRAAQLRSATEPSMDEQQQGRDVFLSSACVMCHTIRGTPANGQMAPDLTHLASRASIAAGTLPYSRGNLAAWIVDPQTVKPGSHMPNVTLSPADLQSLLAYLDGLK